MPKTKYEADSGDIHELRARAETIAAAGTPPSGEINNDIIAKISKSEREFGLRPRGVRLYRVVGTAPNQFNKYRFLPVLTPTAYDSSTFAKDATISIGGVSWTVGSKVPEDY